MQNRMMEAEKLYSIEPVHTQEHIKEVAALAEVIWHDHYDPIIGEDQVKYMLEKFQSEVAMRDQINHKGYQYFIIVAMGFIVGYFAIREDQGALFLSKLYIDKKYRGRNYARKALDFMLQLCGEKKLLKIWLTVNRNNESSINIYERFGFVKAGTQVADIGDGFVMDDYIMELLLDFAS